MLFGVSYYYELLPYDRLAEDIELMRAAGINVVRVGDGIWARCEPVAGEIDVEWFARVLDALHGAGIQVILCTPTYAVPPWLARRHPEVMARSTAGRQASYGARQNVDLTHPGYRFHAERIIRRIFERYATHPSVIGFQVDNETGTGLIHNEGVEQAFAEHLRTRFGSVERLNEVWGLDFWSHRLGDWADLWPPEPVVKLSPGPRSGNTNPGYDLEWRRFHARLTTEFLTWQAGIVREYARDDQFVTHDIVGGHGRGDADRWQIAPAMDVSSENLQHGAQDDLTHPPAGGTVNDQSLWSAYGPGPYSIYLKSDLGWSGRRGNFLVTETNAGGPGGSANTFPGYDGQLRAAAYAAISRGANMIMYWPWHTIHYGFESHVGGIVNHAFQPGRVYQEIARLGQELAGSGDLLTDLTPDADVAFLYSTDSRYAMQCMPPLKQDGGAQPDPLSYERIFNAFYRAFFDARAQATVLHPGDTLTGHPVLVAPALFIADDILLDRLVRYAQDGGHLVLTFRCGCADEYARMRWQQPVPGPLRQAVGARVDLWSNLPRPLPVRAAEAGLELPAGSHGEAWADELELEDATALAHYEHPHFGRFPAAVTRAVGRGRVSYVGTLPNGAFGRAFASWVCDSSGVRRAGAGLPEPVRVSTARARSGQALYFVTNWSSGPHTVPSPVDGRELVHGTRLCRGADLVLQPWAVTVIVEAEQR
jgi:beta-galactosidase